MGLRGEPWRDRVRMEPESRPRAGGRRRNQEARPRDGSRRKALPEVQDVGVGAQNEEQDGNWRS